MKTNSVYILFLQFTSAHYNSGVEVMQQKVLSKIKSKNINWIVIDNAINQDVEVVKDQHFQFISGDNSSREFSGFDKAINYLKDKNPKDDDIIIFANDTFHRSYGADYLDKITYDKISKTVSGQGFCGYVDGFPKIVTAFGLDFSEWVRTSFFIMPYGVVKKVIPFVISEDRQKIFGDNVNEFFRDNNILSGNYKTYLKTWLYEEPLATSEFKEKWHSKKRLDNSTLRDLQDKCWCILCEQNLSARAMALGVPFIRINDK